MKKIDAELGENYNLQARPLILNNKNADKINFKNLSEVESVKPNKKYVSFREAHAFARSLNLKTRKEWRLYVKSELEGYVEKPKNIPSHPDGIYKVKGWQGWKYWLGTADSSLFS